MTDLSRTGESRAQCFHSTIHHLVTVAKLLLSPKPFPPPPQHSGFLVLIDGSKLALIVLANLVETASLKVFF